MLRPWHLHRTYSCRNHFFGLHFLATQWRFECLGGQFGVWCGAAVGSRLGMPSCDHEALMLEHWPSKRPHFTTERVECCNHGLYVVCAVAGIILCCSSFFWQVMATAKIQPQKMNFCDLGFGKLVSGIFKGLASHNLAATKNFQAQEMKMWSFKP